MAETASARSTNRQRGNNMKQADFRRLPDKKRMRRTKLADTARKSQRRRFWRELPLVPTEEVS